MFNITTPLHGASFSWSSNCEYGYYTDLVRAQLPAGTLVAGQTYYLVTPGGSDYHLPSSVDVNSQAITFTGTWPLKFFNTSVYSVNLTADSGTTVLGTINVPGAASPGWLTPTVNLGNIGLGGTATRSLSGCALQNAYPKYPEAGATVTLYGGGLAKLYQGSPTNFVSSVVLHSAADFDNLGVSITPNPANGYNTFGGAVVYIVTLASGASGGGLDMNFDVTVLAPPPPPPVPAYGVVVSKSCVGTSLHSQVAQGDGTTFEVITANSTECGYVAQPAHGTLLSPIPVATTSAVHSESQIPVWVKDYYPAFYDRITAMENWCYTNKFILPPPPYVPPPVPPVPDPLPTGYVPYEPPAPPDPSPPFAQPGILGYKTYFKQLGAAMNTWKAVDYQAVVLDLVTLTSSLFSTASLFKMVDEPNPTTNGVSTKDLLAKCDAYAIFNMTGFMPATIARKSAVPPFNLNLPVGTDPVNATLTQDAVAFSTPSTIVLPSPMPTGVSYNPSTNKFTLDVIQWINSDPFNTSMSELVKYGIKEGATTYPHSVVFNVTDIGNIRRTLETRGNDFFNDIDDTGVSQLMGIAIGSINGGSDVAKGEALKPIIYLALETFGAKGSFETPTGDVPNNVQKSSKVFVDMHYNKAYKHLNMHTVINSSIPPGGV